MQQKLSKTNISPDYNFTTTSSYQKLENKYQLLTSKNRFYLLTSPAYSSAESPSSIWRKTNCKQWSFKWEWMLHGSFPLNYYVQSLLIQKLIKIGLVLCSEINNKMADLSTLTVLIQKNMLTININKTEILYVNTKNHG